MTDAELDLLADKLAVRLRREALTLAEAAAVLGIGRDAFYEARDLPGFPRPVRVTAGCRRYRVRDLRRWLQTRPEARRSAARLPDPEGG